jgi:hypothetical protein
MSSYLIDSIIKSAHRIISTLGNPENQAYFGYRTTHQGVELLAEMIGQLEDPLGPAVTLSQLLSSNLSAMKKYAKLDLVRKFLEMIRFFGPQTVLWPFRTFVRLKLTPFASIQRFVNFFEAFCTFEGKALKANQEMILRETLMNDEKRLRTFLKTAAFDRKKHSSRPILPEFGRVFDASGHNIAGNMDSSVLGKPPLTFIGKDLFENEGSFPSIFVQWTGADKWAENMDELFWSPASMGLTLYTIQDEDWVLLQEFSWVLDRPRLCKVFTGKNWSQLEAESKKDPILAARLHRQNQLAEYYVGQLTLHGKQCFGRSYNCIDWFAKIYPYTTLAAIAYSPHLPSVMRSAACDLIMSLYLDRYPQSTNCGKPTLPECLWVYEVELKCNVFSSREFHDMFRSG